MRWFGNYEKAKYKNAKRYKEKFVSVYNHIFNGYDWNYGILWNRKLHGWHD